jgi:hypothetical protein
MILGAFSSEVVYDLKKEPQGAANFKPNSFGKLRQNHANLTRVLDVDPSLFLAGEVQPPLIYLIRGDCRLNNTQLINSSITFYLYFYPLPLFFFFLVLRSFFLLQGGKPRGPRGDQVDLGQPIAAATHDGVPPGQAGLQVYKSIRRLSCVSRRRSDLLRRELRCITPGVDSTR